MEQETSEKRNKTVHLYKIYVTDKHIEHTNYEFLEHYFVILRENQAFFHLKNDDAGRDNFFFNHSFFFKKYNKKFLSTWPTFDSVSVSTKTNNQTKFILSNEIEPLLRNFIDNTLEKFINLILS